MKKTMQLIDLLYKVDENVTIWVAEDPNNSEGIYFGVAGEIKFHTAAVYEVVEFYPEHYPAIGNRVGITIIVKKADD